MKKRLVLISLVSTLAVGALITTASLDRLPTSVSEASDVNSLDGDAYDSWLNSWSKPGHVYFHYNRGDKTDYDKFCLWIWNDNTDTDGTLWAYSGKTDVSNTLTLVPMSNHWMQENEIPAIQGGTSKMYLDKYGVICDVDLTANLKGGKAKHEAGQQPKIESASYDGCDDLGFLFPKIDSMNGETHWTSDGGKDNDIDDWMEPQNWRDIKNTYGTGKTQHIFLSSGHLTNWSYYAGSGIPEVKVNPMDADKTGGYSSKVDTTFKNYGVSTTSSEFKKLGVGYQIFVSSFRDSDGDGMGDLRGVINSLDYIKELGTDVIWLTPIQQSDSYHGYDISDYYAVDKRYGTIDDYRELLFKAHQKGMKVIMDLVLNHTSKSNIWFTKSQWGVNSGAPGAETDDTGINWRNVFTWKYKTDNVIQADRTSDGTGIKEPVHYSSITVEQAAKDKYGPSWYKDGEGDYYYYGKFGGNMPEINYENNDTRKLVTDMAKYWLSFGLDGFRLDAVKHIYMVDEVQADNGDYIVTDVGSKNAYDEEKGQRITQPYDYSSNQTKNIKFWKQFSNELKSVYPNCFLVGENFDGYGHRTAGYYQGLDSQFNFANYYHVPGVLLASGASAYATTEEDETFNSFKADTTEVYVNGVPTTTEGGKRQDFIDGAFTSNHDVMRAINQANAAYDSVSGDYVAIDNVGKSGDNATKEQIKKAKIDAAVTMLHPGISWIYYGDELGMSSNTDTHIATYGNENSMDIWYRQPMLWADSQIRPSYTANGFKFEHDSYNKSLLSSGKGVSVKSDASGKETYTCKNEMFEWYKAINALKARFPDNAQLEYDDSSSNNILIINVWGENAPALKIYINIGRDNNEYLVNPGNFKSTPVAQIGCSGVTIGTNIGANPISVVAFEAN